MFKEYETERVATEIVDAALRVHRGLGPGLLESSYQACLLHVLQQKGIATQCEVDLPLVFEGVRLEKGYRMDMVVSGLVVIENKAVQQLTSVHLAQMITYLKLSGLRIGFLINWNVARIKDGLKRVVHD